MHRFLEISLVTQAYFLGTQMMWGICLTFWLYLIWEITVLNSVTPTLICIHNFDFLGLNLPWQYNSCVIINFQPSWLSTLMVTHEAGVQHRFYAVFINPGNQGCPKGTEESICPHQSVAIAGYLSPVWSALLIGARVSADTLRKGEGPMKRVNCLSGIIYLNTPSWCFCLGRYKCTLTSHI